MSADSSFAIYGEGSTTAAHLLRKTVFPSLTTTTIGSGPERLFFSLAGNDTWVVTSKTANAATSSVLTAHSMTAAVTAAIGYYQLDTLPQVRSAGTRAFAFYYSTASDTHSRLGELVGALPLLDRAGDIVEAWPSKTGQYVLGRRQSNGSLETGRVTRAKRASFFGHGS